MSRLTKAQRGCLYNGNLHAPIAGDINNDGVIDFNDYNIVGNLGNGGPTWEEGDFNGDGVFDFNDLNLMDNNWLNPPTRNVTDTWQWTLDAVGNWTEFKEDDDGGGSGDSGWSLDQNRAHNEANEIDGNGGDPIWPQGSSGGWVDPVHDAAGNTTFAPKPGAETTAAQALNGVYDAWNRLAAVYSDDGATSGQLDGSDTLVATYRYDALGRRIRKIVAGDPDITYDYYYSGYQVVEVRKDGDADPLEQYVWDGRYVHSPCLRWRDADTDGQDIETLYYCNDANFNVTALVDTDGDVVERVVYDPYGKPTFLKADWTLQEVSGQADGTASAYANEVLFTGHRRDPETGLYVTLYRIYHPTLGRWLQRDPGGYVDGMNVFENVGSAPTSVRDPHGLVSWNLDRQDYRPLAGRNPNKWENWDYADCTLTVTYEIQILWKGNGWNPARKAAFQNQMETALENAFGNTAFKLYPTNEVYKKILSGGPDISTTHVETLNCCPCRGSGVSLRLDITFVPEGETSVSEDWEVNVTPNAARQFIPSSSRGSPPVWGFLDEDDTRAQPKAGGAPGTTQVPVVHEFGHAIGLEHPGEGIPGANPYTHQGLDRYGRPVNGPRDLMGCGSDMQPFYFDEWKEHMNSQYPGCDYEVR